MGGKKTRRAMEQVVKSGVTNSTGAMSMISVPMGTLHAQVKSRIQKCWLDVIRQDSHHSEQSECTVRTRWDMVNEDFRCCFVVMNVTMVEQVTKQLNQLFKATW